MFEIINKSKFKENWGHSNISVWGSIPEKLDLLILISLKWLKTYKNNKIGSILVSVLNKKKSRVTHQHQKLYQAIVFRTKTTTYIIQKSHNLTYSLKYN